MEHGYVLTLNRWIYKAGGTVLKQCKLCFRCLGDGHLGQYCNQTRVCGIDNCKELHHRLLHSERGRSSTSQSKRALPEVEDKGLKLGVLMQSLEATFSA